MKQELVVLKNNMNKAVYIHIPFCKERCSYCDFCKMYYDKSYISNYIDSLTKEINTNYKNEIITSIYIGGGTPSILDNEDLERVLKLINKFNVTENIEITIEFNVKDICEDKLILLKNYGVNRLSIGVQTINEKFYKILNRSNDSNQVIDNINLCKKYFDNISIDLMYGFYNETIKDLDKDLEFFINLNINHISIYSLIIEEHTKLYIDKTPSLDEELESDMYYHIISYLKKFGFKHYEISNFSLDGYMSKHNLTYWNNKEYYGFGLGASGYINGVRYTNTRSLEHYNKGSYIYYRENISKNIDMENEMMLGLRKIDGVSEKDFYDKFHIKIEDIFNIKELLDKKLLIRNNNYISIPEDKLYVSNSIIVNFIEESKNE